MSTQASLIPPADPDMADKLTTNRAGGFTPSQRRNVFLIGAARWCSCCARWCC